jgi:hypothetical protein
MRNWSGALLKVEKVEELEQSLHTTPYNTRPMLTTLLIRKYLKKLLTS